MRAPPGPGAAFQRGASIRGQRAADRGAEPINGVWTPHCHGRLPARDDLRAGQAVEMETKAD